MQGKYAFEVLAGDECNLPAYEGDSEEGEISSGRAPRPADNTLRCMFSCAGLFDPASLCSKAIHLCCHTVNVVYPVAIAASVVVALHFKSSVMRKIKCFERFFQRLLALACITAAFYIIYTQFRPFYETCDVFYVTSIIAQR